MTLELSEQHHLYYNKIIKGEKHYFKASDFPPFFFYAILVRTINEVRVNDKSRYDF